jgi:acyl dehydratase
MSTEKPPEDRPGDVEQLDTTPNLVLLYAKAAVSGLGSGGGELPETALTIRDVAVDRDHLAAYDRVCGFRLSDALPATYLHVIAFPLSVKLMTARAFPFALPGLVHIANRISQLRPLDAGERFDITVHTRDLRPHAKGQQFDVVAEATVEGEAVWTDTSTYLRRGGGDGSSSGGRKESTAQTAAHGARWRIPADTGRRYAAVSGDINPIHLDPVTSRLFGFPRPIAHGMWTAARCLAALEGRLPDRFDYDVELKLPILLPATVAFSVQRDKQTQRLRVRDARTAKPHLAGEVSPR